MTRKEIGSALERAASNTVDRDFAAQAWSRGRTLRRRRQVGVTTAGSLALAAAAAGAVFLGGIGEDTAQPLDPADTPVATDAPTGEQAQDGTPAPDGSATTRAVDDGSQSAAAAAGGPPAVVVLLGDDNWQPSGDLEPATTQSLTGGSWVLGHPFADWAPLADGRDGVVSVSFDGTSVEVKACDALGVYPAQVSDGRLVVDTDAEPEQEFDDVEMCGSAEVLLGFWTDLLGSQPYAGTDGTAVVLARPWTQQEATPASLVFGPDLQASGVTGQLTAADRSAVDRRWEETAEVDAGALDPPVIDTDLGSAVRWSRQDGQLAIVSPCPHDLGPSWVWEGESETRLIALAGNEYWDECGEPEEEGMIAELLTSVPAVLTDGSYLVLQGRIDDPVAGSELTAEACSSTGLPEGELVVGEASDAAADTARRILQAARSCQGDVLVQMAEEDATKLSRYGDDPLTTLDGPLQAFAFPEEPARPYARLVDILTSGEPGELTTDDGNGGSTVVEYAWPVEPASEPGSPPWSGYVLRIAPDGTWVSFYNE